MTLKPLVELHFIFHSLLVFSILFLPFALRFSFSRFFSILLTFNNNLIKQCNHSANNNFPLFIFCFLFIDVSCLVFLFHFKLEIVSLKTLYSFCFHNSTFFLKFLFLIIISCVFNLNHLLI